MQCDTYYFEERKDVKNSLELYRGLDRGHNGKVNNKIVCHVTAKLQEKVVLLFIK